MDLIHPPFVAELVDVEVSLPGGHSDDTCLYCLLFDLSFCAVLSFDIPVLLFLLLENIVGKEGRVRVDLRSTLLLLEVRLGRLTI